ncbi:MAG: ATP-binding protein [Clostridiales bacterium]|nr:ATP-binding protein [Clostridiales bacterium]
MKKKNVINLIKYYSEKNDAGFRNEAYEIAKFFDDMGESQLSQYIMALLSDANTFSPQIEENDLSFFRKLELINHPLPLPELIKDDVIGIVNAVNRKVGVNKYLFEGAPGTGKTETVKHIARILERDLFIVDFETVVDSKLGQTSKNIAALFKEIENLSHPDRAVILFDEIDAIAIDRINSNDLREMGRATSAILKWLDGLNDSILLIATTNLYSSFDKALVRRFDAVINFNRYSREDLLEIAVVITNELLSKYKSVTRNSRLLKKIIGLLEPIPYPGELKNLLKISIAFSDPSSECDYLKRIFKSVDSKKIVNDIKAMQTLGFTVREIEILTGISKSQVSRELNVEGYDE